MREQTILVDTHAHFKAGDGVKSAREALLRAEAAGVSGVVVVGGSRELNDGALQLSRSMDSSVPVTLGLDRSQAADVAEEIDSAVASIREMVQQSRSQGIPVVAIGEIGLDYHYEADSREAQKALFAAQLELAGELMLPVVVHSREADDDTLDILARHGSRQMRDEKRLGVLHCYTGSLPFASKLQELGMFISFSGIVTFKNADMLRSCAAALPLDSLLVETDSPYLAPVPLRGKRNEPANVVLVASCLAEVRQTTVTQISAATTENARRLFGISV